MGISTRGRGRYERRSLARQRRVQRRLEQVQALRHRPRPAGAPVAQRLSSPYARSALFVLSLGLGLGLARVATVPVLSWWSDEPSTLRTIAVQGTHRLSGAEVARTLMASRGEPIARLSREAIEARVRSHPWIRSARVALLPTGTAIVDVQEREPRAVLRRGEGDAVRWHFVDREGVAFAPVDEARAGEAAGMPALASADGDAGEPSRATLGDALTLLARLDALGLPGLANDERPHRGLALRLPGPDATRGWVLTRDDGATEVILGGDADAVLERLDRLEQLLAAGLEELERTRSIDLRFAGQAVLRTEGASG